MSVACAISSARRRIFVQANSTRSDLNDFKFFLLLFVKKMQRISEPQANRSAHLGQTVGPIDRSIIAEGAACLACQGTALHTGVSSERALASTAAISSSSSSSGSGKRIREVKMATTCVISAASSTGAIYRLYLLAGLLVHIGEFSS